MNLVKLQTNWIIFPTSPLLYLRNIDRLDPCPRKRENVIWEWGNVHDSPGATRGGFSSRSSSSDPFQIPIDKKRAVAVAAVW